MQEKIAGLIYFEIISWDPRGVGASIPLPVCFENDLQRQQYGVNQEVAGGINTSFPLASIRPLMHRSLDLLQRKPLGSRATRPLCDT